MRYKILGWGAAFAFCFLITLVAMALAPEPTSPVPFDSKLWKSGDRDLRGRMVASLLEYPSVGSPGAYIENEFPSASPLYRATVPEVAHLLGPADHRSNLDIYGEMWMSFYLGTRGHWSGGQFVLHLYFDAEGRVKSFFVGR